MSKRRSVIEHEQETHSWQSDYARKERIQELIKKCSKAISAGERKHYIYVATKLSQELIPELRAYTANDFSEYDEILSGKHEGWHWSSLRQFIDNHSEIIQTFYRTQENPSKTFELRTEGILGEADKNRKVVKEALESCGAIAERVGAIESGLVNRITVNGFSVKLGEKLQNYDKQLLDDPVRGVTLQAGSLKTLFCGGTGFGKSAGLEREAEDFYLKNFEDNASQYKIIDLVDLDRGENWFYDIPQQDNSLKWAREKMGLKDEEFKDRDLEIYVPLSPGVSRNELPYDTEEGEFVVKPFTIPASDIRKPLLVSLIMSRLTPSEEQTIREAYDHVDEHRDDWALVDLAAEIESNDDLNDRHKRKAASVLRSLQNEGFIRTRDDPRSLDWKEIFNSTKTVTLFSQSQMQSELGKIMCVALLTDIIIDIRRDPVNKIGSYDLPECVLVMRELWEIVPHQRRDSFDDRISAVQEALGGIMTRAFRKNRHFGIHLLFDTQQIGDLLKPVREMFNRYVVYSANWDTVKNIFSWTQNDRSESFKRTLTAKVGQAGIVGQVEPAVKQAHVEFLSPVDYAPPAHHHFDKDNDTTGWHTRVKYIESEELRRPFDEQSEKWNDDVPDELKINVQNVQENEFDARRDPIKAFAEQCIVYEVGGAIIKDDVRDAYNAFRIDHGQDPVDFEDRGERMSFGQRLARCFDRSLHTTKRNERDAYRNFRFTWLGKQYADAKWDDLSDVSEPIDVDKNR